MYNFDLTPEDLVHLARYRATLDLSNFPKGFLKDFAKWSAEAQDEWYEMRFKCCKDHLYLSGYLDVKGVIKPIMGMDFQPNPHELLFSQFIPKRPGEDIVLSDLERTYKKRMILWSRGVFKTSAVVVDIVQNMLNYPDVRICFLTGGNLLAKRQLRRVKDVFEKPKEIFKRLFPEYCFKSVRNRNVKNELDARAWEDVPVRLGTAQEFSVPCRVTTTMADPTFAISTAKSVKAGSHFDIIYIDDLVNDQNYRSVNSLEKCYQEYLDICPLLDPVGFMIVTGTRYSFGDTYERLQEAAREEERLHGHTIWKFSIRGCWSWGCKNCKHTDVYHNRDVNILQPPCTVKDCLCPGYESSGSKGVLFPQVRTATNREVGHTLEFLEAERTRLTSAFFANQYENQPMALEDQTFTETLIGSQTVHDMNAIPTFQVSESFIIGDLAYVGEEGKDFTVLYACHLYQGRLYVFDCLYGNWDSAKLAENVVNFMLVRRPRTLFFEKVNGSDAFERLIRLHAAQRGVLNVPLQWMKCSRSKNSKLIRIGSIKGWLSNLRLWLFSGMPGYDQLVQQLTKWPKLGKHDDFADCLGLVVEAPTGCELTTPRNVVPATHWLRQLQQAAPVSDDYPDTGGGSGLACGG